MRLKRGVKREQLVGRRGVHEESVSPLELLKSHALPSGCMSSKESGNIYVCVLKASPLETLQYAWRAADGSVSF